MCQTVAWVLELDLASAPAGCLGPRGEVVAPKTAVPDVGRFACLKDTEENVFGVTRDDPAAKQAPPPSGRR